MRATHGQKRDGVNLRGCSTHSGSNASTTRWPGAGSRDSVRAPSMKRRGQRKARLDPMSKRNR